MQSPLINRQTMADLWRAEDTALLREIVGILLQEITQRCATIESALARVDRSTLRQQAQGLRGAAANVCADRLADAAAELERIAATASEVSLIAMSALLCGVARETFVALRFATVAPDCEDFPACTPCYT